MQTQAFRWWKMRGLLASLGASMRSMCNSASVTLSPSEHAVLLVLSALSSCHVTCFWFCFGVVLFRVSIVYERLEMHSACRGCTRSSTVIKYKTRAIPGRTMQCFPSSSHQVLEVSFIKPNIRLLRQVPQRAVTLC